MDNIKNLILTFSIKRIKLLMLNINERNANKAKDYNTSFTHSTHFNIELNLLILNLKVSFLNSEDQKEGAYLDAVVQTAFEIPEIKQYINESNKIELPNGILTSIVSISISHTRAILANNTSGTSLQDMIIPLVDPLTVTSALFPEDFGDEFPNAADIPEQSL